MLNDEEIVELRKSPQNNDANLLKTENPLDSEFSYTSPTKFHLLNYVFRHTSLPYHLAPSP